MKKILSIIALCLVCAASFGQTFEQIIEKGYSHSKHGYAYFGGGDKITYATMRVYVYFDRNTNSYVRCNYSIPDTLLGQRYKYIDEYEKEDKSKIINITTRQSYKMPAAIYDRYAFGCDLSCGGWVTFSLGFVCEIIGGALYIAGKNNTSNYGSVDGKIKAGAIIMGLGGTCLSVAIPLLCFGDAAKREAKTDYYMWALEYKK